VDGNPVPPPLDKAHRYVKHHPEAATSPRNYCMIFREAFLLWGDEWEAENQR
jgi:hypothetical protein